MPCFSKEGNFFFSQKNSIFLLFQKGFNGFNLYRCKYLLGYYRGSMSMWKIFPKIYRFIQHLTLSLMFKRFQ